MFNTGILAGGIIMLVSELFIAESLSQVYANVHEILWRNDQAMSNLSKQTKQKGKCCTACVVFLEYICYDDGCHLRKFANNASHKDLTSATKKIANIQILVAVFSASQLLSKYSTL